MMVVQADAKVSLVPGDKALLPKAAASFAYLLSQFKLAAHALIMGASMGRYGELAGRA